MLRVDEVALSVALSAAIVGGVALGAAPARRSQTPSAILQTTPILVDVVVTDRAGHPVPGLGAGDFELREDGEPRAVEACDSVDAALGRLYVLAIDTVHLSSAGAKRIPDLLGQFVTSYFGSHDRAVVVTLGTPPRRSGLIGDRQELLRLVESTSDSASRVTDASAPSNGLLGEFGVVADRGDLTEQVLGRLGAAVQGVAAVPGHRISVLLVSEGLTSTPRRAQEAEKDFFAAAARAHASVYPIDPRGMRAVTTAMSAGPDERPIGVEDWNSLREIADATGGRPILGRRDLDAAFLQMVQDASTYYVLTYRSPHAADRDGHFHKVTVRVTRPGVIITARKGWYASKNATHR